MLIALTCSNLCSWLLSYLSHAVFVTWVILFCGHRLGKSQGAYSPLKHVTIKWKVQSQVMVCKIMFHLEWLMSNSLGSEECPFPYPQDDSKDWSPDSPITIHLRPRRVHSGTQTEGPHLSSAASESSRPQPSLLVPVAPPLTSCPSPVPQRKQRYCAKWENRASVVQKHKEPEEESKPSYESLHLVSLWTNIRFFFLQCTVTTWL